MKIAILFVLISGFGSAQFFDTSKKITKEDTLKGSNTHFRDFWDVKKYDISVEPEFASKSIKGNNVISFQITKDVTNPIFQIDLQQPMQIGKINCNFPTVGEAKRKDDFIFIQSKKKFKKGEKYSIDIAYFGNPIVAKNAPWDGGWVFDTDNNGNPFVSVAQQGNGVSLWLPTKDIWEDEPENGITMTIITPKDLVGVGNGRLISKKEANNKNVFVWETKNTINPYSFVPNIAKYVNFKDQFSGEKGNLDLDYWVLDYNLDKAKKQFQQVKPMLEAFEYWFGPYPFYEDSYKLVETPYLGMEHQSNIAYGNQYKNGYLGGDLSMTGVGLKWDYIIVHESGHEWFANSITAKDVADMWIHEAFTTYSETLFVEKYLSKKDADKYVIGERIGIVNDKPIIGKYGIRDEGSTDMYYKGANMIHTIRQVIDNDEKFREILRGLNKDFYHQTVTTKQVEDYFSKKSGIDLSSIFNQYLRTIKIPTLEYKQNGNSLQYRYTNAIENLKLPIKINDYITLKPSSEWQTITLNNSDTVIFNKNYLIKYYQVQ